MGTSDPAAQWRVECDAEVVFGNGGSLRTEGFRLDIPGDDISDAELGELLVRHLGLLMEERTTITRKQLIREPHKGSRGTEGSSGERTVVDLAGEATTAALPDGLELERSVDLPVARVRLLGAEKPVADRLALAALELAGHAVLVHTGTDGPFLTDEAGGTAGGAGSGPGRLRRARAGAGPAAPGRSPGGDGTGEPRRAAPVRYPAARSAVPRGGRVAAPRAGLRRRRRVTKTFPLVPEGTAWRRE